MPSNNQQIKNCEFVFNDTVDCDYCFVIDSVDFPITVKCPKDNLILCVGEPQSVKIYPKSYYSQFGRVASFYEFRGLKNIDIKIPLLPWMAGVRYDLKQQKWDDENVMTFDELYTPVIQRKLDKIAIITSNKAFTRGHRKRLEFILKLKEALPNLIDLYGSGFNTVEDKYDVLKRYKYSLVIENSQFYNYMTEKLMDAYLSECFPIYIGCPNVHDFFSTESLEIGDIKYSNSLKNQIKKIVDDDYYSKHYDEIVKAKRTVLNKYNVETLLSSFAIHDFNASLPKQLHIVKPINRTLFEKIHATVLLKYYQFR